MASDHGDRKTATRRETGVPEREVTRPRPAPRKTAATAHASGATARRSAGPPTRRRVPWGSLSRGQVVDAATAIVEAGGSETMTIRSLAAELGVAPMSLYRHVRDKDDLLDEVVDRLLAAGWRPEAPTEDWRRWIAEAADRLRALLVSQPAALRVFLRHPVVSPASIERMEAVLAVLKGAGLPDDDAWRAFATLQTYTVGFSALEASRAGWSASGGPGEGLAGRLASITTQSQFMEGLGWVLDALERRVEEVRAPERRPPARGARAPAARPARRSGGR